MRRQPVRWPAAEAIGVRKAFVARLRTVLLRYRAPLRSDQCPVSIPCCSDSNLGEPLDCELVGPARVPADSDFPCGPRLRGDVVRALSRPEALKVDSLAALNELIVAGDLADDARAITGRPVTIEAAFTVSDSRPGLPRLKVERCSRRVP
jgi:hypothetical protein